MKKYRFWLRQMGIAILAWASATAIFAFLTQTRLEGRDFLLDVLLFSGLYNCFAAFLLQYGGTVSGLGIPILMGVTRKQVCRGLLLERLGYAVLAAAVYGLGAFLVLKNGAEALSISLSLLGVTLTAYGIFGLISGWRIRSASHQAFSAVTVLISAILGGLQAFLVCHPGIWALSLGCLVLGTVLAAVGSRVEKKNIYAWDVSL